MLCLLFLRYVSAIFALHLWSTSTIFGIAVLNAVYVGLSMSRGRMRRGAERSLRKWIDGGERLPERRGFGLLSKVVGTVLLLDAPIATIGDIVQHQSTRSVIDDVLWGFGMGLGFIYLGRKLRPR